MLNLVFILILSYLLGSFPTGIIAGRMVKGIDLREHGSGNTGATNTFRVLGWKTGIVVALIDMFKGFAAAAFLTKLQIFDSPSLPESLLFIAATLAAVAGHIKPIFAGFRGGRGFGTAVGAVTAQVPLAFPICLFIFFLTLGFTGYVSVCAAVAALSLPLVYIAITRFTETPFDPVLLGFFIFAFFLTLFGVRKKLFLYFKGEAEVFEKVRIFRRKRSSRQ